MTIFDYCLIAIVISSGILGLIRGFIKEVFSLVAYILSFIGALWWGPNLIPVISNFIDQSIIVIGLSYFLVFIGILLVVGIVNKTLTTLISLTGLGPADRGLGLLFGVIRGLIIFMLGVVILSYSPLPNESWWQEAYFSTMITELIEYLSTYIPEDIVQYLPSSNKKLEG